MIRYSARLNGNVPIFLRRFLFHAFLFMCARDDGVTVVVVVVIVIVAVVIYSVSFQFENQTKEDTEKWVE